ncbi:Glutathione S-transferase zeta class [Vitis vinifera]|uniref:Glutathione S-transferase zeta class n=1 Tax=Vitis vinifera TaxID=29760 RepID=A0A438IW33_VITVI|nr:Glutathione S-transferase zeta class [Vitis vinifera]
MSSSSKLVLYSYWQSSCAWRVRFALNLKGLAYEYRSVNLRKGEQFSPEFKKLNPLCFVPVLVDGDIVVSDSFAILLVGLSSNSILFWVVCYHAFCFNRLWTSDIVVIGQYLNEKYPQNALLPSDPQLRALNLQASNIVSSSMQPLIMQSILKYIEDKFGPAERQLWVRHNIEKVSKADVFLAPQIAVAEMRFNIDMSKFPTLNGIYKSCKDLPEFQASVPERQPDAEL